MNWKDYALGMVGLLVGEVHGESQEAHYLREHAAGVRHVGECLEEVLNNPGPGDVSLATLAARLNLHSSEILAAALAAAVEDDLMASRTLAYAQSPVGGSRPTLGLLQSVLAEALPGAPSAIPILAGGAAVRSGLLHLLNESAPLPERCLAIDTVTALALHGQDAAPPSAHIGLPSGYEVPLTGSVIADAERLARSLVSRQSRVLVVRCASSREGCAFAEVIAAAMSGRPLFIEGDTPAGLAPLLFLRGLVPVFCFELAPSERRLIPAIPGYDGPALCVCGPDGMATAADGTALQWSLGAPTREERCRLWSLAIDSPELASDLARYHRHGAGRIAQIGAVARDWAALRGSGTVSREDILEASWSGEGADLGALAQAQRDRIPDAALVLSPALKQELEMLLLRCRERDQLTEGLGASLAARYHPGVRALFVGPSGAGKTLAASWLATRLGVPLYKIDLAAVTSKYIGETEKNLSQIFARAERSEVMLLFDEADSLFGKRTEVRESNDRFANAQTNYLLQRIETFDGIAVLTSNNRSRFDSAFVRRLDMIVEFPAPGPEERRALWESHLGKGHTLQVRDLNLLAASADLCGGHIRNAVLVAAVIARDADRLIAYADVVAGLETEFRKLGRQMPVQLRRSP